jgi:hypothetical protein
MLGALLLTGCGATNADTPTNATTAALESRDPAASPAPAAVAGALPPPTHSVTGRIATVTLPYRTADGLVWVSATKMSEAAPFVFKGIEIKPGSGPNGTDLSVFTYEAERAGMATLRFGLVPPGKMLIGLPSLVYTGPVTARYEATVSAP